MTYDTMRQRSVDMRCYSFMYLGVHRSLFLFLSFGRVPLSHGALDLADKHTHYVPHHFYTLGSAAVLLRSPFRVYQTR